MQRTCTAAGLPWTEKICSAMRQREADNCMKRLEKLPPCTIYDENADQYAQQIWEISYDKEEKVFPDMLRTPDQLKEIIMSRFPDELMSLSSQERILMKDAAMSDTCTRQVEFTDEIFAAESIARRMWGKVIFNESTQHFDLILPTEICLNLVNCLMVNKVSEMNSIAQDAILFARALLYIMGTSEIETVIDTVRLMHRKAKFEKIKQYDQLIRRTLLSECDWVKTSDGRIMLLHDAVSDTDAVITGYRSNTSDDFELDSSMLMEAQNDVFDIEIPKLQKMLAAIMGSIRQEINPTEAVNDLRFIVKQGATFEDCVQVLKTMITTIPTHGMLEALRDICEHTPRWVKLASEVCD